MTQHDDLVLSFEHDGSAMPRLGFGTWRLSGDACRDGVAAALASGYRHIDTAAMYGNEEDVGAAIAESTLTRDELFVTTKVWRDDLRHADLLRSAEASLRRLGCDHIDLLLVHWPNAAIPLAETMAALNVARERGLTRHIGVSNFSSALLRKAAALSEAPLVANQCEYHPGLDQSALIDTCRSLGVAFVAYRPLGQGRLLDHPVIQAIAVKLGKTAGQVILRWHMQQDGVAAIPRSAQPVHIAENRAIFDFMLSESDMQALFGLATPDGRHVNPAWAPAWDPPVIAPR